MSRSVVNCKIYLSLILRISQGISLVLRLDILHAISQLQGSSRSFYIQPMCGAHCCFPASSALYE